MVSPAEQFLLDFHAACPGATAQAFGALQVRCRGAAFPSSYAVLAQDVPHDELPRRVLDVGCGNGHLLGLLAERGQPGLALAGLDMSAAELAAAAPEVRRAATLLQGRAQSMPLATGSVAIVLSHMALMLMDEIESVLAEIARVLEPGGTLGFVVGAARPPTPAPAFSVFLEVLERGLQAVPRRMPHLGDRRFRTEEGIRELLAPGFDEFRADEIEIERRVLPEEAWASFDRMYDLHQFDAAARARRRSEYLSAVRPHAGSDGRLDLPGRLRHVRAVRRRP